jgi:hypothetical protein
MQTVAVCHTPLLCMGARKRLSLATFLDLRSQNTCPPDAVACESAHNVASILAVCEHFSLVIVPGDSVLQVRMCALCLISLGLQMDSGIQSSLSKISKLLTALTLPK